MDMPEGARDRYGDREHCEALRNQCWNQLQQYAMSHDLWWAVQSSSEALVDEHTILTIAERRQFSGQIVDIPYILSYVYQSFPLGTVYMDNPLDRDRYAVCIQRIDNLFEEYKLHPQGTMINHYVQSKLIGTASFDSQITSDICSLRIPSGVDEYARYYEQYRSSQAYFLAHSALFSSRPAVIKTHNGDAYHVYETANSDTNGVSFPNIALSMVEQTSRPRGGRHMPRTIQLAYGNQPAAFYVYGKTTVSTAVDLAADLPGEIRPIVESNAPNNAQITTVDQLIDMLRGSTLLSPDRAAALLQHNREVAANIPRMRLPIRFWSKS